jgi:hypothetical protein
MEAVIFIIVLILVVFAREMAVRWWRQRAWRRQWRKHRPDDKFLLL